VAQFMAEAKRLAHQAGMEVARIAAAMAEVRRRRVVVVVAAAAMITMISPLSLSHSLCHTLSVTLFLSHSFCQSLSRSLTLSLAHSLPSPQAKERAHQAGEEVARLSAEMAVARDKAHEAGQDAAEVARILNDMKEVGTRVRCGVPSCRGAVAKSLWWW
jgi:hypothetical protein